MVTVARIYDNAGKSCRLSRKEEGFPLRNASRSKQNSSIRIFREGDFARINTKYYSPYYIYIYMFLTENLVTLFTGNSRNNFIGRVAMNIAYVKRVHILFRIL